MKNINFILAIIFLFSSSFAVSEEEQSENKFEFKTVSDALVFLKTRATVTFFTSQPDGWLIANESNPFTIWSFTPEGHYAHPAVVKRELKQSENSGVYIEMTALCQAEKEPCDKLIDEFVELNKKIAGDVSTKINK